MSINRIQKLLFSEYSDFEDMVLVESPFAQTTRDGIGVRQVQLGLTPSKLVLATDNLPVATVASVAYLPGIDPDVETFELVAIYPIECVNLSVYHRRKRRSLKAHFCNNRVLYFELGGFETRNMFWNLWCEKVKFLSPEDPGSSYSETSIATCTTNSTLYLQSAKNRLRKDGAQQLWCQFGAGDYENPGQHNTTKWTDKYLYLGKYFDEIATDYTPNCEILSKDEFLEKPPAIRPSKRRTKHTNRSNASINLTTVYQINRFSSGVRENCSTGLFLPAENYLLPNQIVNSSATSSDQCSLSFIETETNMYNYMEIVEDSVKLWEQNAKKCCQRGRQRKRYSFAPQSHFLQGLGPWNVTPGERFSVQRKRAVSLVNIRRQPTEPGLRLPVSKRQLVASISCEELYCDDRMINTNSNTIKSPPRRPVIFFWTPDYWYRPRSAKDAYIELQTHLNCIRVNRQNKKTRKRLGRSISAFMKKRFDRNNAETESENDDILAARKRKRKRNMKLINDTAQLGEQERAPQETSLQFLRRMLKLEVAITAWDFDSATLAYQMTIVDRDLFLKIPISELGVLLWQQSSKNAPNIGALIAFSHRISCLVTSEVLRESTEKNRARLIARFINTAEKCNKMSNFQSCRSLLCGLQSPPVYRLFSIWTYVRKRHSTKYEVFQNLCKLYRDPRLPTYQKTFKRASQISPHMPYIGDIIYRLLGQVPEYRNTENSNNKSDMVSPFIKTKDTVGNNTPTIFRKLLSSLRVWPMDSNLPNYNGDGNLNDTYPNPINSETKPMRILDDFYPTLETFDDSRLRCLKDSSDLLEKHQRASAQYIFSRNELAMEYLLKARYKEDRDNFKQSFTVEKAYKSGRALSKGCTK